MKMLIDVDTGRNDVFFISDAMADTRRDAAGIFAVSIVRRLGSETVVSIGAPPTFH